MTRTILGATLRVRLSDDCAKKTVLTAVVRVRLKTVAHMSSAALQALQTIVDILSVAPRASPQKVRVAFSMEAQL